MFLGCIEMDPRLEMGKQNVFIQAFQRKKMLRENIALMTNIFSLDTQLKIDGNSSVLRRR